MDALFVVLAVGALLVYAAAAAWLFDSGTPAARALRQSMRRPRALLVAAMAAFVGLALGVPWVYAQTTDDAPEPLSFDDATPLPSGSGSTTSTRNTLPPVTRPGSRPTITIVNPSITAPPPTAPISDGRGDDDDAPESTTTTTTVIDSPLAGSWQVGAGSVAGYRANEVLVLQTKESAGRTSNVTGSMVISGLTVQDVDAVVDMASVTSDNGQRDEQYRGRIMDVAHFPTSEFHLTSPIELDGVPDEGAVVEREATGDFTIRGVTRSVTIPLQARIDGGRIEVLAHIPVTWAEYGIPDPSNPLTRVEDHGEIELLLLFDRT